MDIFSLQNLPFYLVAAVMLGGAVWTVSSPNILHAAIGLITTFFATALLYLLLNAEFIALAQVTVYIGGVLIFVVFTILLTTQLGEKQWPNSWKKLAVSGLISLVVFSIFARVLVSMTATLQQQTPNHQDYASLLNIGTRLLSAKVGGYVVPFEVMSILLLSCMIGAIVITRRPGEVEQNDMEAEA